MSIAFDLPTQIGLDSDHPLCIGEVGKVGVAINTLADMEALFEAIPLDQVSTSMTINAARRRSCWPCTWHVGREAGSRAGQAPRHDPERHPQGVHRPGDVHFSARPSLRLIENMFEYCSHDVAALEYDLDQRLPHSRGRRHGRAGARVHARRRDLLHRDGARRPGCTSTTSPRRLAFFFAAHSDFFEEIAKFRAARRLYSRIMKERFGARKPESMMLRFHTQTSGVTLTAQQPDNNVVRVTLAGARRRARRHAEPAHQQQGRGPRAAERRIGPAGAAHTAGHRS